MADKYGVIRGDDHPLPWVSKFGIVGSGANVYDANGVAVFSDRMELWLAILIAQAVNTDKKQS